MHKCVLVTGLVVLVAANILFAWVLKRPTPLVGAALYALIAFQVFRRNEYRAAFIVGTAGAGLHLFESLRGSTSATWLVIILAITNIVLPAIIALVGLRAWRRQLASAAHGDHQ